MEQYSNTDPKDEVVSVKEWMLTILITIIPIVNVIMYFVWAFGDNTNRNKANWARATLMWMVIGLALLFLFFVVSFWSV